MKTKTAEEILDDYPELDFLDIPERNMACAAMESYANQIESVKQNQKLIAALKLCLSNFERNKTGGFNGEGKRWEDGSPYQIAWTLLNNIEMDSN